MYTIGRLAKMFNLSRSTLLYYDKKGLLKASARTASNYRAYTEKDRERLSSICMYRSTGLSLEEIGQILDTDGGNSAAILENQLDLLNEKIAELRKRQHIILRILKNDLLRERAGVMDKETWISILRSSGLDDEGMNKWHIEFERLSPEAHRDFLKSLGMPDEEVEIIRELSRNT